MTFFNNLKIIIKIATSLALLIIIGLGVAVVSSLSLSKQVATAGITEHTFQVLGTLQDVSFAMARQESSVRGYIISANPNFLEARNAASAAYDTALASVRKLTSDNQAQQVRLDELQVFVDSWNKNVAEPEIAFMSSPATRNQAVELASSGTGKQYMDGVMSKIKEMVDVEAGLLDIRSKAANEAVDSAQTLNIIGGLALLAFAILSLVILNAGLVRPLTALNGTMATLASGKTDIVIPGIARKDEVGEMASALEVFRQAALANKQLELDVNAQRNLTDEERRENARADKLKSDAMAKATSSLAQGLKHLSDGDLSFQLSDAFASEFESLRADYNAAVSQLAQTLSSVAQATRSIDSGSVEISKGSEDLSKRTEQQAASLEETAAALDQITANVSNSSKRADEARTIAAQANASAAKSGEVVANAVNAMQRIEQSSNQIASIIGVIDEIAFQTNLLALNAGVEAARAGEAGRGFAVVAQEVRELAQRSAKAAKEIKDLIRNSSVEVQSGVKLVSETGEALQTIEGYIVTVNTLMDSIATSAREQSVGLAEVNTAVNQMDQVTQQNAAMVEETSAASATLASEAARLRELIGQFQLGTEGGTPATALRQVASAMSAPSRGAYASRPTQRGNAALKQQEWSEF
jgi:methyl-accepting chemotaxis protein